MDTQHLPLPNHHADHGGFSGASGLLAAISFLRGRNGDALLASRLVGLHASDRLVDIGCGPGVAARHAATLGAEVIGVDPAAVMLRVARRRPARSIAWRLGAAESLPVADGWATVVWSLATVHHWKDIAVGIAEVRRVLAPGGRFTVLEREVRDGAAGHASHGWSDAQADSFMAYCADAGFVCAAKGRDHTSRGAILSVTAQLPD